VPIIALSAIIDEEVGRDALDCGMDDALGKPFANDDLRKVIHPWLARTRCRGAAFCRGFN
jgi:DNA-binding response OmpR family regulator